MKAVFLHGLGHTAKVWDGVIAASSLADVDCLEKIAEIIQVVLGKKFKT